MNIERLNHLKSILESVSKAQKAFDLGSWIANRDQGLDLGSTGVVGNKEHTCGTTCCAMGYAALDPEFQAEGLSMQVVILPYENASPWHPESKWTEVKDIKSFNQLLNDHKGCVGRGEIFFDGDDNMRAGAKFFGITYDASEYLFDPDQYQGAPKPITPEMVIERIDEVIANDGRTPYESDWGTMGEDEE